MATGEISQELSNNLRYTFNFGLYGSTCASYVCTRKWIIPLISHVKGVYWNLSSLVMGMNMGINCTHIKQLTSLSVVIFNLSVSSPGWCSNWQLRLYMYLTNSVENVTSIFHYFVSRICRIPSRCYIGS